MYVFAQEETVPSFMLFRCLDECGLNPNHTSLGMCSCVKINEDVSRMLGCLTV